jgi:hypothetical protein
MNALTPDQIEQLEILLVRQRHLQRQANAVTPAPGCPACDNKRLHSRQEWWTFHPDAGSRLLRKEVLQ